MSRIGWMPIPVPKDVVVDIKETDVTVTGPKGKLHRHLHPDMTITLNNDTLQVTRPDDERLHRSLHVLTRTLLVNMVRGVSSGFVKELEITGVGYRAEKADDKLILRLGFSHLVEVPPLPGVSLELEGNNRIKVCGIDKEVVGEMAARIRALRRSDVYKGKGIRYAGEVVRHKAGKAGKAIGGKE